MEARKVSLCQRQSVSNWYKSTLFLKEEMVATRPILRMCDNAVKGLFKAGDDHYTSIRTSTSSKITFNIKCFYFVSLYHKYLWK